MGRIGEESGSESLRFLRAFFRSRYPLAIAAGALLAAAFPDLGIAGMAWIAPGLILVCGIGKPAKTAFRLGYVAGVAHYLVSLSWLLNIPVTFLPILAWAALAAFLALYPGVWVWWCWKIYPVKIAGRAPAGETGAEAGPKLTEQFLAVPLARRLHWTIACAALWVAWEMIISRFLGGFPWNLLGNSQFQMTPIIQIASFTGVYGVSFLAVWTAVSLMAAVMVVIRGQPIRSASLSPMAPAPMANSFRSAWFGDVIFPAAVVGGLFLTGYHTLLRPETKTREITVALIQPSIPQNMIWDRTEDSNRFQEVLQLSRDALTNKPDIVIWPESAVPELVRLHADISDPIAELARTNKVWLIICADDYLPHPGATNLRDSDFFNSSFLVSPEGRFVAEYKKRNLVIFGEYVPLVKWMPFLKYLTPIDGGFTAGDRVVPFDLKGLNAHVSVLICFEDVFAHFAREYVMDDTDFLVNLTNDGWFGEGSAQRQQAAAAVFRAVENGVPLVRCSNNGLTCWADSHGRLRQVLNTKRGIYGPGFLIARIPAPEIKRAATFYRRHGDWFGWGCVGFGLLQVARVWRRKTG